MSAPTPTTTRMNVEDFRRLGVRPNEARLAVIRHAATRSSRFLAKTQLSSPTRQTELQLSKIATSAYRLMDPRQRVDAKQRVHIGRIVPNVISAASPPASSANSTVPPFHHQELNDLALTEFLGPDGEHLRDDSAVTWQEVAVTWQEEIEQLVIPVSRQRQPRRPYPWVVLSTAGLFAGLLIGSFSADDAVPSAFDVASGTHGKVAASPESISELFPMENGSGTPLSEFATDQVVPLQGADIKEDLEEDDVAKQNSVPSKRDVDPSTESSAVEEQAKPSRVSAGSVNQADDSEVIPLPSHRPDRKGIRSFVLPPLQSTAAASSAGVVVESTPSSEPARATVMSELPRLVVPDDAQIRSARRRLLSRLANGAVTVTAKNAEQRILSIRLLKPDFKSDAAQVWTAGIMVAEAAWLNSGVDAVARELQPLVERFQVSIDQPMADSLIAACSLTTLPETQRHLLNNSLRLSDRLLMREYPDLCERLIAAATPLAKSLGDSGSLQWLQQSLQAAEQMKRLSEAAERMRGKSGSILVGSDLGLSGRYYCLMLRRWDVGLQWLGQASDPRLASVAREEADALGDATPEDLARIANRWLIVAARSSGRAADSMRLHAIDLWRRVADQASGLKKLESERKINKTLELLPQHLRHDSVPGWNPAAT